MKNISEYVYNTTLYRVISFYYINYIYYILHYPGLYKLATNNNNNNSPYKNYLEHEKQTSTFSSINHHSYT